MYGRLRSYRDVLRSFTPIIRFYRDVLRSFTPAVCRIAPNRTACVVFRSYSAVGRDRHSCVLESSVRLSGFVGSLRACAFLYGDPDGERRRRGNAGDGERSRRRSVSAFLRDRIGFAMFSAGSTLGLKCGSRTAAAPDCAKEPLALWTLFI